MTPMNHERTLLKRQDGKKLYQFYQREKQRMKTSWWNMNGKQLKTPQHAAMGYTGKLVPQDPNDEPTSVLLEKIRQKKNNDQRENQTNEERIIIYRGEDNSYERFSPREEWRCDEEIPFEIPKGGNGVESHLFLVNPKVCRGWRCAAFIPMEAISAGYGSEFRFYESGKKLNQDIQPSETMI